MANRTVTIKSSGGDYTSLNAAFAGEDDTYGDLLTNTMILTFECYNPEDTTAADTGTGYTPSGSYYLNVDVISANRHALVWDAAKANLTVTSATALKIQENFTRVNNFQISSICSSVNGHGISINGGDAVRIINCIVWGQITGTGGNYNRGIEIKNGSTSNPHLLVNNLVFGWKNTTYSCGIYVDAACEPGDLVSIYNCTVVDCKVCVSRNDGTVTCKNVLAKAVGSGADGFHGTLTTSYCASNIASDLSGTGDRNEQTFTFVNEGASNYHLSAADAGALGYGTNLYDDATYAFQTDGEGNDRGGSGATWDIGADEYVSAVTTVSAGKQDLTLSVQAPTISIDQQVSHSAAKQDLALLVLPTSVSTSAGININAGKQDLSFSINTAQARSNAFYIDIKRDITFLINSALFISDCSIGVNKQNFSFSIYGPVTRLSSFIFASKQDLSLLILQPSISSTQSASVSASKQDLTFSALQAAVSTSAGIQVIAGKQDLSLSAQTPTVRLDSVQEDTTRDLTLSINSSAVSTAAEVNIAAGKQDFALSINTVTVTAQAQNSYAASCQSILLSILSSFQKIDHYEAINKQDLTIAANSPSVSIDTLYSAAAVQALSFSQLPIEFFITHSISTGKQDLSFSVNQVAVSVAQVQGALIVILNQTNLQPAISVLAYQPQVAVN